MPEFFETGLGRVFYQRDVPAIAKSLDSIATSLQKLIKVLEAANPPTETETPFIDDDMKKSLQTIIKLLEALNPEPVKTPPIIPQSRPSSWVDDDMKLTMDPHKPEPEWLSNIRLPRPGQFWKGDYR